jgi:CRP-like cAMP-binding protein
MLDELITAINWDEYHSSQKKYRGGIVLIEQGSPPSSLFILVKGALYTYRNKVLISSVEKVGEYFGEVSILMGIPHSATVETVNECTIIEIPKEEVIPFLTRSPSIAISLARSLAERLVEQNAQLARKITEPLKTLEEKKNSKPRTGIKDYLDLEKLKHLYKEFRPHVEIIVQGRKPIALYILVEGKVEIIKNNKVIAVESTPGYYLGDVSVLRETAANASVKTIEKTTLIEIPSSRIMDFLKHSPEVAINIARKLAERLLTINDEYLAIQEEIARKNTLKFIKKNQLG